MAYYVLVCLLCCFQHLYSLPQSPDVSFGNAKITSTDTSMNIEASNQSIVNWDSFSLSENESLSISTAGSNSRMLHRVYGSTISEIAGSIQADCALYLVNSNGFYIADTGKVHAHSTIISSLDIADQDFLDKTDRFEGDAKGNVSGMLMSLGSIKSTNGDVILLSSLVNVNDVDASGDVIVASCKKAYLVCNESQSIMVECTPSDLGSIFIGGEVSGDNVRVHGPVSKGRSAMNISETGALKAKNDVVIKCPDSILAHQGKILAKTVTIESGELHVSENSILESTKEEWSFFSQQSNVSVNGDVFDRASHIKLPNSSSATTINIIPGSAVNGLNGPGGPAGGAVGFIEVISTNPPSITLSPSGVGFAVIGILDIEYYLQNDALVLDASTITLVQSAKITGVNDLTLSCFNFIDSFAPSGPLANFTMDIDLTNNFSIILKNNATTNTQLPINLVTTISAESISITSANLNILSQSSITTNALTFIGPSSVPLNIQTEINFLNTSTPQKISSTGPLVIGAAQNALIDRDLSGTSIDINQPINSNQITLSSTSDVTFNATVSAPITSSTGLIDITCNGDCTFTTNSSIPHQSLKVVSATGELKFDAPVQMAGGTTITTTTASLTAAGDFNVASGTISTTQDDISIGGNLSSDFLTLTSANDISINGNISSSSLSLSSSQDVSIGGTVTLSSVSLLAFSKFTSVGDVNINGAINALHPLSFDTGANSLSFQSTIMATEFSVTNSGSIDFYDLSTFDTIDLVSAGDIVFHTNVSVVDFCTIGGSGSINVMGDFAAGAASLDSSGTIDFLSTVTTQSLDVTNSSAINVSGLFTAVNVDLQSQGDINFLNNVSSTRFKIQSCNLLNISGILNADIATLTSSGNMDFANRVTLNTAVVQSGGLIKFRDVVSIATSTTSSQVSSSAITAHSIEFDGIFQTGRDALITSIDGNVLFSSAVKSSNLTINSQSQSVPTGINGIVFEDSISLLTLKIDSTGTNVIFSPSAPMVIQYQNLDISGGENILFIPKVGFTPPATGTSLISFKGFGSNMSFLLSAENLHMFPSDSAMQLSTVDNSSISFVQDGGTAVFSANLLEIRSGDGEFSPVNISMGNRLYFDGLGPNSSMLIEPSLAEASSTIAISSSNMISSTSLQVGALPLALGKGFQVFAFQSGASDFIFGRKSNPNRLDNITIWPVVQNTVMSAFTHNVGIETGGDVVIESASSITLNGGNSLTSNASIAAPDGAIEINTETLTLNAGISSTESNAYIVTGQNLFMNVSTAIYLNANTISGAHDVSIKSNGNNTGNMIINTPLLEMNTLSGGNITIEYTTNVISPAFFACNAEEIRAQATQPSSDDRFFIATNSEQTGLSFSTEKFDIRGANLVISTKKATSPLSFSAFTPNQTFESQSLISITTLTDNSPISFNNEVTEFNPSTASGSIQITTLGDNSEIEINSDIEILLSGASNINIHSIGTMSPVTIGGAAGSLLLNSSTGDGTIEFGSTSQQSPLTVRLDTFTYDVTTVNTFSVVSQSSIHFNVNNLAVMNQSSLPFSLFSSPQNDVSFSPIVASQSTFVIQGLIDHILIESQNSCTVSNYQNVVVENSTFNSPDITFSSIQQAGFSSGLGAGKDMVLDGDTINMGIDFLSLNSSESQLRITGVNSIFFSGNTIEINTIAPLLQILNPLPVTIETTATSSIISIISGLTVDLETRPFDIMAGATTSDGGKIDMQLLDSQSVVIGSPISNHPCSVICENFTVEGGLLFSYDGIGGSLISCKDIIMNIDTVFAHSGNSTLSITCDSIAIESDMAAFRIEENTAGNFIISTTDTLSIDVKDLFIETKNGSSGALLLQSTNNIILKASDELSIFGGGISTSSTIDITAQNGLTIEGGSVMMKAPASSSINALANAPLSLVGDTVVIEGDSSIDILGSSVAGVDGRVRIVSNQEMEISTTGFLSIKGGEGVDASIVIESPLLMSIDARVIEMSGSNSNGAGNSSVTVATTGSNAPLTISSQSISLAGGNTAISNILLSTVLSGSDITLKGSLDVKDGTGAVSQVEIFTQDSDILCDAVVQNGSISISALHDKLNNNRIASIGTGDVTLKANESISISSAAGVRLNNPIVSAQQGQLSMTATFSDILLTGNADTLLSASNGISMDALRGDVSLLGSNYSINANNGALTVKGGVDVRIGDSITVLSLDKVTLVADALATSPSVPSIGSMRIGSSIINGVNGVSVYCSTIDATLLDGVFNSLVFDDLFSNIVTFAYFPSQIFDPPVTFYFKSGVGDLASLFFRATLPTSEPLWDMRPEFRSPTTEFLKPLSLQSPIFDLSVYGDHLQRDEGKEEESATL